MEGVAGVQDADDVIDTPIEEGQTGVASVADGLKREGYELAHFPNISLMRRFQNRPFFSISFCLEFSDAMIPSSYD